MKLNNEIKKLIVTEKSNNVLNNNIYVFKVDEKMNKNEISTVIESLFNVKVLKVRTSIMPSKRKRVISKNSSRAPRSVRVGRFKKAYIQLAKDNKIDLNIEEVK
jgi:large subunit ribosomal protein L23